MDNELIGAATPVHIRKWDGSYHRRWPGRFVVRKGPLYVVAFGMGEAICRTPEPADDPTPVLAKYGGNVYLYADRWFNISRMKRDGRTWYYVNIATPVEFDGASFHTIDLDLDVSWYADGTSDEAAPRSEFRGLKARATEWGSAESDGDDHRLVKARAMGSGAAAGAGAVVLDEEEFLDHSERMRYPAEVIEQARAAVDQVLGMIGQRAFPFDGT